MPRFTVSKPYRIIRRSLRTKRFTLLECKAVSDSSVISRAVSLIFGGLADIIDTRGPFNPKGSLVLPLLYRQTCHLFVLHAIFSDETKILPLAFFFLTFSEVFFIVFCSNGKFENYS